MDVLDTNPEIPPLPTFFSLTLIRTVFLRNLIGTYVDICQHAVFMCFMCSMLMRGVFKYFFVFL